MSDPQKNRVASLVLESANGHSVNMSSKDESFRERNIKYESIVAYID